MFGLVARFGRCGRRQKVAFAFSVAFAREEGGARWFSRLSWGWSLKLWRGSRPSRLGGGINKSMLEMALVTVTGVGILTTA